mmetsp:Transcript_15/g.56  ORF Transcript_15/g.56 Transcript_15/m.56 type:complete len:607 (+) Transcript_15:580-2400(+)
MCHNKAKMKRSWGLRLGGGSEAAALEHHDVSRELLVVVRLPLGIPVYRVADPLPVWVVLLVQPWVARSKLVHDPSQGNPLAPVGLLVEDLGASKHGGEAPSLHGHLPREVDVVVAPPAIVHLVVPADLLPDLLGEGGVHPVKVGPRLPALLHVLQDLPVREPVVPGLEVVGLAQDARVPLRLPVVLQELVVGVALSAHEDPLRGDHVRHVVGLGGQELVHVLQEVLVQDDVAVHANDVVVLGLLNSHVPGARHAEGVLQLPPLDQGQVELGPVLLVDRVNVVGGVVVHDDDLELEVGLDLLVHQPGEGLPHDGLLVERGEHAREVDPVGVQVLHVLPGVPAQGAVQLGLDAQDLPPRGPLREPPALLRLVVGLVEDHELPLGLHRARVAGGLVVHQEVSPHGGLVPRQHDLGLPLGAEVLLHPVVLLLGALGVEVWVGRGHDQDVVAGVGHGLDGLHGALVGAHALEEPGHAADGLDLLGRRRGVVLGDVPVQALARGHDLDVGVRGLERARESLLVVAQGVVHVHQDGQLVVPVVVLGRGLRHDRVPLGLLHLARGHDRGVPGQTLRVAWHVGRHILLDVRIRLYVRSRDSVSRSSLVVSSFLRT